MVLRGIRPPERQNIGEAALEDALAWYEWAFGRRPTEKEFLQLRARLVERIEIDDRPEYGNIETVVAYVTAPRGREWESWYDLWLARLANAGADPRTLAVFGANDVRQELFAEWLQSGQTNQAFFEGVLEPDLATRVTQAVTPQPTAAPQPTRSEAAQLRQTTLATAFRNNRISREQLHQGLVALGIPEDEATATVDLEVVRAGGPPPTPVSELVAGFRAGTVTDRQLISGLTEQGLDASVGQRIISEVEATRPAAPLSPEDQLEQGFNAEIVRRGLLTVDTSDEYIDYLSNKLKEAKAMFARRQLIGGAQPSVQDFVTQSFQNIQGPIGQAQRRGSLPPQLTPEVLEEQIRTASTRGPARFVPRAEAEPELTREEQFVPGELVEPDWAAAVRRAIPFLQAEAALTPQQRQQRFDIMSLSISGQEFRQQEEARRQQDFLALAQKEAEELKKARAQTTVQARERVTLPRIRFVP